MSAPLINYKTNSKPKNSWKPHIDLFYNELICDNKYSLELKFPRQRYSWSKLDGTNFSLSSRTIFDKIFFKYSTTEYITDKEMGIMLVDFIRLLNIHRTNKLTHNDKLYYLSFHRNEEHEKKKRKNFTNNIAELLKEYINSTGFCITRSPQNKVNVWEHQPPRSLSYYTNQSEVTFNEKKPGFDLLYEGNDLFSFLIQIKA